MTLFKELENDLNINMSGIFEHNFGDSTKAGVSDSTPVSIGLANEKMSAAIPDGAFLVARKIFESEFWLWKPISWKIIWIYILGRVNHKAQKGFERGEGYFNFEKDHKNIGREITVDMVKKFLMYARKNKMIDTKRSTRGMRLKVLKYELYQTLTNYEARTKAREKHERSTPINKNDKNGKKDIYSNLTLKEIFEREIKIPNNENTGLLEDEKVKFLDYWTEHSLDGNEERWHLEGVFGVRRRWSNWIDNYEKRQRPKQYTKPGDDSPIRVGGMSSVKESANRYIDSPGYGRVPGKEHKAVPIEEKYENN